MSHFVAIEILNAYWLSIGGIKFYWFCVHCAALGCTALLIIAKPSLVIVIFSKLVKFGCIGLLSVYMAFSFFWLFHPSFIKSVINENGKICKQSKVCWPILLIDIVFDFVLKAFIIMVNKGFVRPFKLNN